MKNNGPNKRIKTHEIENYDKLKAINEEERKKWPRKPLESPIDPTRDSICTSIFFL